MDAIIRILVSEFFWGIVVGALIALLGAWVQARLHFRYDRRDKEKLVCEFLSDSFSGLINIINSAKDIYESSSRIPDHKIEQILSELSILGRNREHISRIRDEKLKNSSYSLHAKAVALSSDIKAHLGIWYQYNIQNPTEDMSENEKKMHGVALNNLQLAREKFSSLSNLQLEYGSLSNELRKYSGALK
ncbi:hypothetical protein GR183_18145 [Stappia sp. GBMRC 2046]|uniref:Uncharacterized protein n=1 Tax=Stappia sediminis TaxID=2692190 RepID=A0A7X3S9J6_9HYPH|nr:hypothetical protein [Stappia sediminis]MXN66840.1 hypothetical protein [Stappia sediminis]